MGFLLYVFVYTSTCNLDSPFYIAKTRIKRKLFPQICKLRDTLIRRRPTATRLLDNLQMNG